MDKPGLCRRFNKVSHSVSLRFRVSEPKLFSFSADKSFELTRRHLSMASIFGPPTSTLLLFPGNKTRSTRLNITMRRCDSMRPVGVERTLEEVYGVRVENKVSPKRLEELGVSRWSVWKTGKCRLPWDWQVDQLVYIEEGEVRVVPEGSRRFMQFVAGDLVRYPKWFEADLYFNAPYRERYSFRAYGDDN